MEIIIKSVLTVLLVALSPFFVYVLFKAASVGWYSGKANINESLNEVNNEKNEKE